MDITKERPQHVWIGYDENDLSVGRWQLIQYEDIYNYFSHCKYQGHTIVNYQIKRREDEVKNRKEEESAAKPAGDGG